MKPTARQYLKSKIEAVQAVLLMERLSSNEHFSRKGEKPQRILQDINLRIEKAESWAIYGRSF